MEWKQSSEKDGATVIPSNWIYIHYYEALNTLFRVENSLRVFVYVVLKNIFFDHKPSLWRKFNEAVMALLLEAHYSKDVILTAYANEIFLGQDGGRAVHGFALASQFYFHKDLRDLKPDKIAVLIGLVKGPSYYDPRRHPERCLKRRSIILKVMRQEKIITEEVAKANDAILHRIKLNPYPVIVEVPGKKAQYEGAFPL